MTAYVLSCLLMGLVGLVIGSFLTVVIKRYPAMLQQEWQADCRIFLGLASDTVSSRDFPERVSLLWPRSYCVHCKTSIPFYHMIPILSFCILRGRCHHCKRPISRLYPWVEGVSALISIAVFTCYGWTETMFAGLGLGFLLIVLTGIDLEHQLLPDLMTIGGLWLGLLCNSFGLFTRLQDAVWASIVGYVVFWLLAWVFLQLRKKNGMGHGDFKMIAMIGAWLGILGLCHALIIAVITSVVVSTFLVLFKRSAWNDPIPFGPFLALGALVSLIYINL